MEEQFFILKPNGAANYLGIMLATVIALKKLDGKGTNAQIAKIIIETHEIDEETQKLLVTNSTEKLLNAYFSWARTYLSISENLNNIGYGKWELTESGYKISNLEDAEKAFSVYQEKSKASNEPNFYITPDEPPNIHGVMLATVIALKELGGSGRVSEIIARVIENEAISEKAQSYPLITDGNRPKLDYYLSMARTYLKYSGRLENTERGVWALTELGFEINSLEQVDLAYLTTDVAPSHDEENWKTVLLDVLENLHYDGFEDLCQIILREAGFIKVVVTAKGKDGGVDGVGFWRENLLSRKIYFQCKRTKNIVGSPQIRDFRGALDGRANQGLFITTNHFTQDAKDEAIRDGALLIDLIDGNEICDLLKKYKLGFKKDTDGTLVIDDEWFNKYRVKREKPKPKKTKPKPKKPTKGN